MLTIGDNCPNCLVNGLKNKVIKIDSIFLCESISCIFVWDEKENMKISNNSGNEKTSSHECPDCNSRGKTNTLVIRGNCYFCEDNLCVFCENVGEFDCKIYISSENNIEKSNENDVEFVIKPNDSVINEDKIELNLSFNETTVNSNNTSSQQLNNLLWKSSIKVLNWTCLPCTMKSHTRIFHSLLLYQDFLLTDNSDKIVEIKKEFSICNALANNMKSDTAKLVAFNFISKLFDVIDFIPKSGLIDLDMDQRVLLIMRNYFQLVDSSRKLTVEHRVEMSCQSCKEIRKENLNDYFITLESNKSNIKLSNNTMTYSIRCFVCRGRMNKSISLKKIPQFVAFHCPNGIKEKLSTYDNGFLADGNESLTLIAVIECIGKFPYADSIENRMNFLDYNNLLTNCVLRQNYSVYTRNTDGWYNLSYKKPFMCRPKADIDIYDGRNIRLLIFGVVPDPEKYKRHISLEEYQKMSLEFKRAELKRVFSQTEDDVMFQKVVALESQTVSPVKRSKKSCTSSKVVKINVNWDNERQLADIGVDGDDCIDQPLVVTTETGEPSLSSSNARVVAVIRESALGEIEKMRSSKVDSSIPVIDSLISYYEGKKRTNE